MNPILFIAGIWLAAVSGLIGVPVALSYWGDYRRAKRLGVTKPGAVVWKRFFFPRRFRGAFGEVAGRSVWIDCWRLGCVLKAHGRVIAAGEHVLTIEAGEHNVTFRPARQSRSFRGGEGAATGVVEHDQASGYGMVIFT